MPVPTRYPGDVVAVIGSIPARAFATAATSSRIRFGDYHSFMVVVDTNVVATSIDAKVIVYDAATSGNSFDLPGAAITQLGADDDGSTCVIEFDALGAPAGYDWFGVTMTASGTCTGSVIILGVYPRSDAASADQAVTERVVV